MADQELARDLGFLEAYTLGLGTMIGAGIFILPGIAAEIAGPASSISFAIGGTVALLAAFSLSELATGMPKAGGSYYYVNHALGSFFGSIVGWGMWGGLMFATAFYMLGFGRYLTGLHPDAPIVAAAVAAAVLLVLINYRGVKETGSLQNVIVLTLVGLILVFIAFGIGAIDTELLTPFFPEGGWITVAGTAGTVFVTFIGFEVIATSAEEIKDPGRNLPLSMIAAVVTPTLFYVLVMLVSTGVLPAEALAPDQTLVPISLVAEQYLGEIGATAMVVGAILATVSSANASILSAARVNFAMGRDKILTEWLNDIHGRFQTPYRAILVTGVVIVLLIVSGLPISTLADVASFMYLLTYTLVHVAVIVMRRADPTEYEPDFRIPSILYPVVPIVGGLACIGVMYQMRPVVQLIGGGIILVGVVWYAFYAKERAISTSLVGEAIAPDEAADGGDVYRVVVPVANPDTERTLLRYAAASAADRPEETELIAVNVVEVPPQTSPAQVEEDRVARQSELLARAREVAADLDVGLRTRAVVGHDAGDNLLSVIEDEDADHVLLGWAGPRKRSDVLFGSTIDPVLERAPCDVTLVKDPDEDLGSIVTLAGKGPNAPVSARRAAELARAFDASLTLLNVQPTAEDVDVDPETVGRETVEDIVEAADLDDEEYEPRVLVSDDVQETLIGTTTEYDTVCVGATGRSTVAQALYGSIPRRIVESADGTVVMARGEVRTPRTLREAIVQRLSRR
ncbi:amino acid transporter [Halobacteriales archaeon QS_1_68_20]|nr:MAG: amino acid transporter [Halobacteriales archaeon QS_1_68_20]